MYYAYYILSVKMEALKGK